MSWVLTPIVNQDKALPTCLPAHLIEAIPQLKFFLPYGFNSRQVDKTRRVGRRASLRTWGAQNYAFKVTSSFSFHQDDSD